MALFQPAIDITGINEGGYQDNPNDSGNYNSNNELVGTNHGISAPYYEEYHNIIPTKLDMQNLTKLDSALMFKHNRWDAFELSVITNQDIANQLFDMFVNHSPRGAEIIIQRALSEMGFANLESNFNSRTRGKVNEAITADLIRFNNNLVNYRKKYYQDLVTNNPAKSVFLGGWIKRAERYLMDAAGRAYHSKSNVAVYVSIIIIAGIIAGATYAYSKN